jgi:hypothetical protein
MIRKAGRRSVKIIECEDWMISKVRAVNPGGKRGEIFVESLLTLPVAILLLGGAALVTARLLAHHLIFVDAASLARAQLYQGRANLCRSHSYWGKILRPWPRIQCSENSIAIEIRDPVLGRMKREFP